MTLKTTQGERTTIHGLHLDNGDVLPVLVDHQGRLVVALAASADTGEGELLTDDITGALATIDVVHHEVHEGETWVASRFVLSLANNASIDLYLTTGALWPHLSWIALMGGDGEMQFYAAPTISVVGTLMARPNLNRGSSRASTLIPYHTPTITNNGTLLLNDALPGGRGPQAGGGLARSNTEWILAAGTNYLMRFYNRSGNNQIASIVLQWYEEDTNG